MRLFNLIIPLFSLWIWICSTVFTEWFVIRLSIYRVSCPQLYAIFKRDFSNHKIFNIWKWFEICSVRWLCEMDIDIWMLIKYKVSTRIECDSVKWRNVGNSARKLVWQWLLLCGSWVVAFMLKQIYIECS